ncbi:MAG: ABC transporter substrate-binding protein [Spirochaetes bacterium]|uniref:ABC transporter substrate-binding protein n=1 Tax=Candidatus Ornithospirochaeta stercoripullorum TaxID=2840899 RepID=A0A9D9E1T6_9SPIO|nr:ABC transporter substrate-binding protein [Candidatus Ornithospirochaeta stercoripullorum]
MKKFITFLFIFALVIIASFSALSAQGNKEVDGRVQIGISKLMVHPALDSIEQGIKDYLNENGVNAIYETQSANGEISTAASIAQLFQTEGKDIVIGIATPTAQALANVFQDVPVVYATVTDPDAAGLTGLENVCGTSDMVPVDKQLEIIEEVTGVKKLGMIYTSAEANGITLMEAMQEACDEAGIELITASISNSSEVMMAAQSIIDRVDAMYVSTDNTVISAISALSSVCMDASVPLFSADTTSSFGTDVLMAGGFDYYQSGRLTGEVVKRILDGEDPAQIGTLYLENLEIYVNLDTAEKLGITIPESLMAQASYIIKDGAEIEI